MARSSSRGSTPDSPNGSYLRPASHSSTPGTSDYLPTVAPVSPFEFQSSNGFLPLEESPDGFFPTLTLSDREDSSAPPISPPVVLDYPPIHLDTLKDFRIQDFDQRSSSPSGSVPPSSSLVSPNLGGTSSFSLRSRRERVRTGSVISSQSSIMTSPRKASASATTAREISTPTPSAPSLSHQKQKQSPEILQISSKPFIHTRQPDVSQDLESDGSITVDRQRTTGASVMPGNIAAIDEEVMLGLGIRDAPRNSHSLSNEFAPENSKSQQKTEQDREDSRNGYAVRRQGTAESQSSLKSSSSPNHSTRGAALGSPRAGNMLSASTATSASGNLSAVLSTSTATTHINLSMPPLPIPPSFSTNPSDSKSAHATVQSPCEGSVLDPSKIESSLTSLEQRSQLEESKFSRAEGPDKQASTEEPINYAGIGSRQLFSPLAESTSMLSYPPGELDPASSPPLDRRALPQPPLFSNIPTHTSTSIRISQPLPPTSSPSSRPRQSLTAFSPTPPPPPPVPNGNDMFRPRSEAFDIDGPYQAARRSLDPGLGLRLGVQGGGGGQKGTSFGPEVCLECLTRDRDLIMVDVTSPGIWARHSDVDFADLVSRESAGEDVTELLKGGKDWEGGGPVGMGMVIGFEMPAKRSIAGDQLTESALKEWTLKNPPASTHRLRTLQVYLRNQLTLIHPDALDSLSNLPMTESEPKALSHKVRSSLASPRRDPPNNLGVLESTAGRARVSHNGNLNSPGAKSIGPPGNAHRQSSGIEGYESSNAYAIGFPPGREPGAHQRSSTMPLFLQQKTPSNSSRPMGPNHQPYSDPQIPTMTTSHQQIVDSRADAPSPNSIDSRVVRPFSFAVWAGRGRSSSSIGLDSKGIFKGRLAGGSGRSETSDLAGGEGSMYGASGSMVDMHLGLERERERAIRNQYSSPYPPAAASIDGLSQSWRQQFDHTSTLGASTIQFENYSQSSPMQPSSHLFTQPHSPDHPDHKKRKGGIKKFFSKLGSGASVRTTSSFGNSPQMLNPGTFSQSRPQTPGEDDLNSPLAPPPSLSFLSKKSGAGAGGGGSSSGSHSSGPNIPRGYGDISGSTHGRSGSGSSGLSGNFPPALSTGVSYSSSQPRSVSTPVAGSNPSLPYGVPPHQRTPSMTSSPPTSSMRFLDRQISRETLGSRKSGLIVVDNGDGSGPVNASLFDGKKRRMTGDYTSETGYLPVDFDPTGERDQRLHSKSYSANTFPSRTSLTPSQMSSSLLQNQTDLYMPSFQSKASSPSMTDGYYSRPLYLKRISTISNLDKDLPPLPSSSPEPYISTGGASSVYSFPVPVQSEGRTHSYHLPTTSFSSGLMMQTQSQNRDDASLGRASTSTNKLDTYVEPPKSKKEKKRGISAFFGR
ncbi:hypothetical protein [Phaffia rhodozyma]|uniref:Uncharacterized protein n=1 Tax=Phaffia rhodozyma TaxID=264483 RepID=A0A0F7SMN0_PHARH|nr:hypothetical protein [Phaffia rhodozyma]